MTDIIDFIYCSYEESLNLSQSSFNSRKCRPQIMIKKANETLQKFIEKIDKNYIKTADTFIFNLKTTQLMQHNTFYNESLKLVGTVSIRNQIFSLRIQFLDQKGIKIQVKSLYHRALLSNFVLQINAQLENFKIQYSPMSGETGFVFNIKSQSNQISIIAELLQFSLKKYFEQCSAHFYLLNLMEYSFRSQNTFLKNIEKIILVMKRWVIQRKNQNTEYIKRFNFYKILINIDDLSIKQQKRLQQRQQLPIIMKYFCDQSRQKNRQLEISHKKISRIYKKFQKHYKQSEIFPLHLINKSSHENYLAINVRQNLFLLNYLEQQFFINNIQYNQRQASVLGRKVSLFKKQGDVCQPFINELQEYIQNDSGNLNITDKDTGKNYFVKFTFLAKQNARKQYLICQQQCRFQSFKFFSQYIHLPNYNILQDGYVIVNAYPRRINLNQFLINNSKILSMSAKLRICINLLQIVITLQKKNKLSHYFPYISVKNLQITQCLYISFRTLTQVSINSLLQLSSTINFIIFNKAICITKNKQKMQNPIQGDQIDDKFIGPSICIKYLKYYLLQLNQEAIRIFHLKQLRIKKKITQQYYQQTQIWMKKRVTNACQELLVILSEYQSIFYNQYDNKYAPNQMDENFNDP